jgi:hypothetical protein
MGRNVTITIWNQTSFDFTDLKKDVEHGKFNQDPPSIINRGKMGVFEVGNHTGAKIGPKGKISYSMGDNLKVMITWDHPFSASTSTYTCYSEPSGKIKSTLSPNHPTGHNQSITFTIEII